MLTHNIDPQEIKAFDAQASGWWDLQGPFKTLHAINPLRLGFITDATSLSGKHVIDVGCGGGILAEGMAKQGAAVTGIDMAEQSLQIAREHAERQKLNISYEHTTVEEKALTTLCPSDLKELGRRRSHETPQLGGSQVRMASGSENTPRTSKAMGIKQFDIVTCMEMLEHVPDPVSIIQACARLVKPDGHLFFSTINRNAKAYLLAILGAEYCLKLLPKGTHTYEKFIKPSELASWLRPANLTITGMTGIGYNPLTKQYSLTQDTDVNYIVHCQVEEPSE